MSEPEKGVCYLTNTKKGVFDYKDEHMARLHLKGSLHAVDRFFNLVRCNLSLLQRPVGSASSFATFVCSYVDCQPCHSNLTN